MLTTNLNVINVQLSIDKSAAESLTIQEDGQRDEINVVGVVMEERSSFLKPVLKCS